MAQIANRIRIKIDVAGETVTFICRRPAGRMISEFLTKRFVTRRNKVESRLYEARGEFADSIILDVENAQYERADGTMAALNAETVLTDQDKQYWTGILGSPVQTWKDLIPLNWKVGVAMYFEDAQGDGEGN
jgi:hypothetical protein